MLIFLDIVNPLSFHLPKLPSYPVVECSKHGRPPSKKQKERKVLTRLGKQLNIGSSDFGGSVEFSKRSYVHLGIFVLWQWHLNFFTTTVYGSDTSVLDFPYWNIFIFFIMS